MNRRDEAASYFSTAIGTKEARERANERNGNLIYILAIISAVVAL